jgi:DNA-directed RNA polymerase specialized sigma24 family protein
LIVWAPHLLLHSDLARHNRTAVWSHAYRLTMSSTAAEDAAAAMFLTAWRRRGKVYLTEEATRAWLLAVASNAARTEWRRTVRHKRVSDRLEILPAR